MAGRTDSLFYIYEITRQIRSSQKFPSLRLPCSLNDPPLPRLVTQLRNEWMTNLMRNEKNCCWSSWPIDHLLVYIQFDHMPARVSKKTAPKQKHRKNGSSPSGANPLFNEAVVLSAYLFKRSNSFYSTLGKVSRGRLLRQFHCGLVLSGFGLERDRRTGIGMIRVGTVHRRWFSMHGSFTWVFSCIPTFVTVPSWTGTSCLSFYWADISCSL